MKKWREIPKPSMDGDQVDYEAKRAGSAPVGRPQQKQLKAVFSFSLPVDLMQKLDAKGGNRSQQLEQILLKALAE